MAKVEIKMGEIGGGDVTYEYVSGTWPASGSNVIPTTKKAKAFVIVDPSVQVWFANSSDSIIYRNNTDVSSSYPVTFNDNNISIGGNYGASVAYKGYVIY